MTSKKAIEIFNFLKSYHDEHGYAPSHTEIQNECQLTYPKVKLCIDLLAKEGVIEYGDGSRMIKLLK